MRMMYDLVYVYLGNFVLFKFLKDVVFFWMIENFKYIVIEGNFIFVFLSLFIIGFWCLEVFIII